MKKLLLILSIVSLSRTIPLPCMNYQTIPKEDSSEELFKKAIREASKPEEIDTIVLKYKKTYWDALNIYAEHDKATALDHILSNIIPPKPHMPEQLYEFEQKEDQHFSSLICTTRYIRRNVPECMIGCTMLFCCLCNNVADCIACFTEPRKTEEQKKLSHEYSQKLTDYKNIKTACKDIRNRAFEKGNIRFIQTFDYYLTCRKLSATEQAFK